MPAIKAQALTAAGIRWLMTAGDYSDGNGLTLRIDRRGNKRWLQRITVNGRSPRPTVGGSGTFRGSAWPSADWSTASALRNILALYWDTDAQILHPWSKQLRLLVIAIRTPCWAKSSVNRFFRVASATW